MKFRLKACGWHLLGSASLMALILGALYLGWYHWPGWFLTDVTKIALMVAGFDVVLGPILTLVIANPGKPRRELARDIAIIVCVQVIAAGYGASTLWNGRILYYTYSYKWLEVVQASDLDPRQIELARQRNPEFAPHWYSLPRWVYAAYPDDPKQREQIERGTLNGNDDVIQMPVYFHPWQSGLAPMRKDLKTVDKMDDFSGNQTKHIKARMQAAGLAPETTLGIPMVGRTVRLFAVVDPGSLRIQRLIRSD